MTDTDEDVAADAGLDDDREIQLVEDEAGFWTLVDSEHGAVGDAPTKAAGLTLMEGYLEDLDVDIPDVEPAEPPEDEGPDKFPPRPSELDEEE